MPELDLTRRLLVREMRGGLKGFGVLLASLFLGVAAIAGVGSFNAAITAGLEANGQRLLGGDVDIRLLHRDASDAQRAWLQTNARSVSNVVEMRAMARPAADRTQRALVELKAVDEAYPLAGKFVAAPDRPLAELVEKRDGAWGAVADANLLTRLGLKLGARVRVGAATFELRARVATEPDRIASLFSFGPRLLVARDSLADTGLVQPGSQIRYHSRVLLAPGAAIESWKARLADAFPDAGWRVRDAHDAAPGVKRFMDRLNLFLSFVGLTVLLVGGIGVTGAVASFLAQKTATIATLKCLGAPGRLVFGLYMGQVLAMALIGVVAGCAAGAAMPLLAGALGGTALPVRPIAALYPMPLALAALFGMLTAATFALWPVARAREIPAAALFRDAVQPVTQRPKAAYLWAAVAGVALLAGLTLATSVDRWFAGWFIAGALATLGLLYAGAKLVMHVARGRRIAAGSALRLAVANLHRPGAATTGVVLSLGLGLSVLAATMLIEGNLSRQITEQLPDKAPAFFFIDIQPDQVARFDAAVTDVAGTGGYQRVPSLRGRIVKIGGRPVGEVDVAPDAQWAVRSDRALTYAARPHKGAKIVAGEWWPADYSGPPLISLDAGLARGFGVKLGDSLTLNVLGREITGRIASLRDIDWRSLRFDFAIVFAPGVLEGAPQTHIAAIEAAPGAEDAVEAAATDAFPNVSAIRVREALEAAAGLLDGIGWAIRAVAGLTVLAGSIVLAGSLAAGRRRRIHDAVVFKVLGATRFRIAGVFAAEYGVLGVVTGLLAGGVGTLTAWAVVRFLMRMEWTFLPVTLAVTLVVCLMVMLAVGFAGTWRALAAPAAPWLRNE